MSTIRQKMANASAKVTLSISGQTIPIIGFGRPDLHLLVIASKNVSSPPKCTYFYLVSAPTSANNGVWMKQEDSIADAGGYKCTFTNFNPAIDKYWQKLTSPDVKLTNDPTFKLDTITAYGTPEPTEIKLSNFTLVATDPNNKSSVTLQDTYALSHQVYRALK